MFLLHACFHIAHLCKFPCYSAVFRAFVCVRERRLIGAGDDGFSVFPRVPPQMDTQQDFDILRY